MRLFTITFSILILIAGTGSSVYFINPYNVTSASISERIFGIHLYKIPSRSMQPILKPRDYIVVSTIAYKNQQPKKMDVIVFFRIENLEEKVPYVKRIIALENDSIKIDEGEVIVNNKKLNEPYVNIDNRVTPYSLTMKETIVPLGKVFVLGDNRDNSSDSRKFGFIKVSNIIGKVNYILYGENGRSGNKIE